MCWSIDVNVVSGVGVGLQQAGEPGQVPFWMIVTAKLNDIDPQAWLADVLARIADIPKSRLHELLPWEWKRLREMPKAA